MQLVQSYEEDGKMHEAHPVAQDKHYQSELLSNIKYKQIIKGILVYI